MSELPVRLPVLQHEGDGCDAVAGVTLMDTGPATVVADLLKALADPTRVRLVDYLAAVPGGTVCACHLPAQLGISQPTLSHHLKKLVDAGIITREQRGRWAHYTVRSEALGSLQKFLRSVTVASGTW
ncbi:MAG: metalloregulator ArsR/SmtB family transcription factor [Propionibacterium sp.]|nr:metalloregulator ArsR/SmtB family transcription factor [Propionibacterium sp.]